MKKLPTVWFRFSRVNPMSRSSKDDQDEDTTITTQMLPKHIRDGISSANTRFANMMKEHLAPLGSTGLYLVLPPVAERRQKVIELVEEFSEAYRNVQDQIIECWDKEVKPRLRMFYFQHPKAVRRSIELDEAWVRERFSPSVHEIPWDLTDKDVEAIYQDSSVVDQLRSKIIHETQQAISEKVNEKYDILVDHLGKAVNQVTKDRIIDARTLKNIKAASQDLQKTTAYREDGRSIQAIDILNEKLEEISSVKNSYKKSLFKKDIIEDVKGMVIQVEKEVQDMRETVVNSFEDAMDDLEHDQNCHAMTATLF